MDFLWSEIIWQWGILLLFLLFAAFYWFSGSPNDYWEKQGISFVPAKPFLGSVNFIEFFFSNVQPHEKDVENCKKYGRIYGAYEGSTRVLMLADPDLLRDVLVKDFQFFTGRRVLLSGDPISDNMVNIAIGEKWKRIRTIITPAFSTGKIRRMTDVILSSAKTVVQNFAETAGKPVDGKKLFGTFTMDVIASTAFATKIQSYQDPTNRFILEAKKVFGQQLTWRVFVIVVFPALMRAFHISAFSPSAMEFFKQVTLEIIEERKRSGKVGNDFLQLLMDATKENKEEEEEGKLSEEAKIFDDLGHDEGNDNVFKKTTNYKSLSHEELIAQCVIFFLAAFDTTASTLTYVSYILALHPEVQEKLCEEVDSVVLRHNKKLTYEAIQEMKYLDNVLTETLRMFPPAIRIERLAEVDYKLGDTGITVEKGTVIIAPIYAIHHDPEFYPEPEKFKPERFSVEEKAKRHPYTYLTFGAGPRNCIGMRFALMEIKLCLAYMVSQLKIKRCPETQVPLKIISGLALLQPKEVLFSVEKREDRIFDGL